MTARQRVRAAMRRENTGTLPLDWNGHSASGISVQAYRNLRAYLGLAPSPLFIYDVIQQLAVVEDDVLDLFEVDVLQLGCEYHKRPAYWQDFTLHDGTPCKIPAHIQIHIRADNTYELRAADGTVLGVQKPGCLYFEQVHFPLLDDERETFEALPSLSGQYMWGKATKPPFPHGFDAQGLAQRAADAQALHAGTQRAIYANFGAKLFEPSTQLYRMDRLMEHLLLEPARMHRFYEQLTQQHAQALEAYLHAAGSAIDVLGIVGDDLGMQTGLLISRDLFCEFLKPHYKTLVSLAKRICPDITVCMHCCGSMSALIPDLAEVGIDAVNPVQISCRDMEPDTLVERYGDMMTFWGGGCDTGHMLQCATPQEIEMHVRRNIETFSRKGGFVFQQVHNILANVPPQNIVAMLRAVAHYR